MTYPNLSEVRMKMRIFTFERDISIREYYKQAGIKPTANFHSNIQGMRLSILLQFIKPMGLRLYVDGHAVSNHAQAKAILMDRLKAMTYHQRFDLLGVKQGHWYYLNNRPQADINYNVFKRYCQKTNIKIEIK